MTAKDLNFPPPLPNPLQKSQPLNPFEEDEKTDPAIEFPKSFPDEDLHSPETRAAEIFFQGDLGILTSLMSDPDIREIMVNDTRNIIVEKNGQTITTDLRFEDLESLQQTVRRLLQLGGVTFPPTAPLVEVILVDGSKANLVLPPIVRAPSLTIRKLTRLPNAQQLVSDGMFDNRMGYFLNACILGKLNIAVCGSVQSGKTSLLNVLSGFIPQHERVMSIEDTPELEVKHKNHVRFYTQMNLPHGNAITATHLIENAQRMRAGRILLGDCRSKDILEALQAIRGSLLGSILAWHANSIQDALFRMETACLTRNQSFPVDSLRRQIASSIDIWILLQTGSDGKKRIAEIAEVSTAENGNYAIHSIFTYNPDTKGFNSSGTIPTSVEKIRKQNVPFPKSFFGS